MWSIIVAYMKLFLDRSKLIIHFSHVHIMSLLGWSSCGSIARPQSLHSLLWKPLFFGLINDDDDYNHNSIGVLIRQQRAVDSAWSTRKCELMYQQDASFHEKGMKDTHGTKLNTEYYFGYGQLKEKKRMLMMILKRLADYCYHILW